MQIAVCKSSIGESVSEWIGNFHLFGVIITISYKYTFTVFHFIAATEVQVGWIVSQFHRDCLGQFTAWIYNTIEDICNSSSACLSAKVSFQNTFHIIDPWHFHRRTIVKNDHSIWLNFKDLSNKTVLAFWQSHMRTVISFRLKTIRKSGEDHNLISSFCSLKCFRSQFFIV